MNQERHPLEITSNYYFNDERLLRMALTHPSYRYEHEALGEDNQRLEFLGDAVLGLMAAQHLYEHFPDQREGKMTKLRSAICNTDALARIARRIDLGQYLLLGCGEQQSGGGSRSSNLADGLEALIGAIYQDGGLSSARTFFNDFFPQELSTTLNSYGDVNPKGTLQEYSQRIWRCYPEYSIVEEDGLPHNREFTVEVRLLDKLYGKGTGSSKQTAQIAAARAALEKLSSEQEQIAPEPED